MSFVGSTMPLFIFRFTGKRNLILYNQFICCVTVFGLGVYCSIFNHTLSSDSPWRWLPIAFFAIIFFSSSMGIMNVPWMLMGEVFPIRYGSFTGKTLRNFPIAMTIEKNSYKTCKKTREKLVNFNR